APIRPYIEVGSGGSGSVFSSEVSKDMLDDMPRQGTALVATSSADVADYDDSTSHEPVMASRRARAVKQKVVKSYALVMFLKPIGIAIGLVLIAYAVLSLGTNFYRSYHRHLDHTAAVHPDQSMFDVFFPSKSLPADAVDLVVKDIDGTLHRVVASKSEAD